MVSETKATAQTVTSQQVSSNVVIHATHVNAMFTDLNKIFENPTGGVPKSIAEVEVGDAVAEDTSGGDTKEGSKDYEDFISVIETAGNRFRLASHKVVLNNAETIPT